MADEKGAPHNQFDRIIAKAWSDPAFKRRLMSDPKGVAKEFGFSVPEHVELRVVENTEHLVHVVVPVRPSADILSDEQLDAVAGGMASTPIKKKNGTC
jgi:hypothetical protein